MPGTIFCTWHWTSAMFPYMAIGVVKSGEVSGDTAIKQLPDVSCRLVMFVAPNTNTGDVYLGASTITIPNGATDATSGYQLKASAQTPWLPASNLNLFYIRCDASTDDILYMALE